jgi:hypothetical protein
MSGVNFSASNSSLWLVAALLVVLTGWLVYRVLFRRGNRLDTVLNDISYDRIDALVVPNVDEGEILIDHLLLTSHGLLILEIKDAPGTVFGGDKLQEWSVIGNTGRFTFSNPQPGLYDRIAAVRHIVRDVPVEGRLLFLDGAEFTKGTPELVSTLDQLHDEFSERDKNAVKFKIEAFKPHWEQLRKRAVS